MILVFFIELNKKLATMLTSRKKDRNFFRRRIKVALYVH